MGFRQGKLGKLGPGAVFKGLEQEQAHSAAHRMAEPRRVLKSRRGTGGRAGRRAGTGAGGRTGAGGGGAGRRGGIKKRLFSTPAPDLQSLLAGRSRRSEVFERRRRPSADNELVVKHTVSSTLSSSGECAWNPKILSEEPKLADGSYTFYRCCPGLNTRFSMAYLLEVEFLHR